MKKRLVRPFSELFQHFGQLALVSTLAWSGAVGFGQESLPAEADKQKQQAVLPRLPEILEAIRKNLPSISEEDLDRAALQGILTEFQSQLELVSARSASPVGNASPALTRYYESSIGYIAAPLLDDSASEILKEAYNRLKSENILRGLVLDLRHVSGNNYRQVTKIVGFFTQAEIPLLDLGDGIRFSEPQAVQVEVPLVVAIDQTTRGAAEALAAIVRSAKLGILVGRATEGQASSYKLIPLKTGHQLKIAAGQVRLADDTALGSEGVLPDISVKVSSGLASSSTSETEDDVSNEKNEDPTGMPLPTPADDPILARAIELLKGIGIVERQNRS